MMDVSKAFGAPEPVNYRGTEVLLKPLNMLEWGQLENWMRQELVKSTVQLIETNPDISIATREDMLRAANAEAKTLRAMDVRSVAGGFLGSPEGMLRTVQLSITIAGVRPTIDELQNLFGVDFDGLSKMNDKVYELSFPDAQKKIQQMKEVLSPGSGQSRKTKNSAGSKKKSKKK